MGYRSFQVAIKIDHFQVAMTNPLHELFPRCPDAFASISCSQPPS